MPFILLGLTRNLGGFPTFFVAPLMRNAYLSLEKASYSERGRAEPKVTVITHKFSTQIILKFKKAKTIFTTHEQRVLVLFKSNGKVMKF